MIKLYWPHIVTQPTVLYNTASLGTNVSEHIVQDTLLDMGLRSKRPTRVPLLAKRHRQLRLFTSLA